MPRDSYSGHASFDVVTTNPPYMIGQSRNQLRARSVQRRSPVMRFCVLWTACHAGRRRSCLCPGGRFYMVHRPFRLAEIMSKTGCLAASGTQADAAGLSVRGQGAEHGSAGGQAAAADRRLTVEKPLIVYKEQGVYTDEIYDIYGY